MTRALAILLALSAAACSKSEASAKPAAPSLDAPAPDPRGCLAATIRHEEHTDDRDGVAHDVRYEDRFVRCEGHVWTERVLPRGVPPELERGQGHRHMAPAFTMARLVTRGDGGATLALVSRAERQIVEIGRESYDTMRFDGDFDAAGHLLAPSSVAAMAKVIGRAAPSGAEWREKRTASGVVRVLWSTSHDFPLEIETEATSGARRDRIVVRIDALSADADLPRRSIDGYARKSDADFMD